MERLRTSQDPPRGAGPRMLKYVRKRDLAALKHEVDGLSGGTDFFQNYENDKGQVMACMAAGGAASEGHLAVLKYLCEECDVHPPPRDPSYDPRQVGRSLSSTGYGLKTPLWSAIDHNKDEIAAYILGLRGRLH